ncbi:MAG: hypothetical protein HUJ69_02605 [Lachnospiraceae bacterium]|nr:hypothetical protein [Lachnospiraceae bacterium]
MRIKIIMESGMWPRELVREFSGSKSISELLEMLIREGELPENRSSREDTTVPESGVFVACMTDTMQELASYYPLLNKIVRITDKDSLKRLFASNECSITIRKVETLKERMEQIRPYVTVVPPKQEAARKGLLGFGKVPVPELQPKEPEEEVIPDNPYDKEKMLCEIGITVEGTDAPPAGSMLQLWMYLLGFVLVAAFLVRSLIGMMNYDAGGAGFGEYLLKNALYLLVPAVIAFIVGKVSELFGKKQEKKKEEGREGKE